MHFYEALEQYGYELTLRPGAVPVVEAKRTDRATISAKAASPLLLELSRQQDAALAYLQRKMPQDAASIAAALTPEDTIALRSQIESGALSDLDEAIAYAKYNCALAYERTSDGRTWIDVLQELLNAKNQ